MNPRRKEIISIAILIIVNFVLLVYLWRMNAFSYETVDDYVITSIVSGMHGVYSPYVIYGNIFYGYLLSFLFQTLPVVNWVAFLYIAASFLAYILLGIVLIKRNGALVGSVLSYIFLACTYSTIYEVINYTKISALVGMIGFLVMLHFVETKGRQSWFCCIIGICMVVWSSWLRFNVIMLVVPFAMGIVLHRIILLQNRRPVLDLTALKKYLVPVLVSTGIVLGTYGYNQYIYQINPEWKEYTQYNTLRTELSDYGLPDYETYQEEYEQIGLAKIDMTMYSLWYFADSDVYSKEVLEKVADLKPENEMRGSLLKEFVKELSTNYLRNPLLILSFVILLFYQIFRQKGYGLLIWWSGIIMLGELFCLHYMGRPIDRVTVIPLICFLAVVVFGLETNALNVNCNREISGSLCLVLGIALLVGNIFTLEKKENATENRDITLGFLQAISSENALYIWDMRDSRVMSAYDFFDVHIAGTLINSTWDGGWLVPSPILLNKQLQYTSDNNLYRALCYESNVYMIGAYNVDLKLAYLRQHYGDDIACSMYRSINGFNIYAFSNNIQVDSMNNTDWNVTGVTANSDRGDFINVEGSIKQSEQGEQYFLEITDNESGKCYTYKISVGNGQYYSAIYAPDWEESGELRLSLIEKRNDKFYRSSVNRYISLATV